MTRRKTKNLLRLTFLNIFFIAICFLALVPILYAFTLSLSDGSSAFGSGLFLNPKHVTLENYRRILTEEPFLLWLKNSVILSVGTMVVAMGFATTASYAFSRFVKCIPTDFIHVCNFQIV